MLFDPGLAFESETKIKVKAGAHDRSKANLQANLDSQVDFTPATQADGYAVGRVAGEGGRARAWAAKCKEAILCPQARRIPLLLYTTFTRHAHPT